jgi:hypothetical protein
MHPAALTKAQKALIDELVKHYVDNESMIRRFLISFYDPIVDAMQEREPLYGLVHSIKQRMKEVVSLFWWKSYKASPAVSDFTIRPSCRVGCCRSGV